MADDRLVVTKVINAPAATIFAVLADPATHASIDGTGWVCENIDTEPLAASGRVFRMAMYHPNHPNGNYTTTNWVHMFNAPTAISWATGEDGDDGTMRFGGWFWRYDLTPDGSANTAVTLTYDWSACSDKIRKLIKFPPFGPEHLANSLDHLAELVTT